MNNVLTVSHPWRGICVFFYWNDFSAGMGMWIKVTLLPFGIMNVCWPSVWKDHISCAQWKRQQRSGRKVGSSPVVKCLLRNVHIMWAPYRLVDQQKQYKQGNLSKWLVSLAATSKGTFVTSKATDIMGRKLIWKTGKVPRESGPDLFHRLLWNRAATEGWLLKACSLWARGRKYSAEHRKCCVCLWVVTVGDMDRPSGRLMRGGILGFQSFLDRFLLTENF